MSKREVYKQKFGKKLRTAREEKGMTRNQLGKMAKMNPIQVSHYEYGKTLPGSISLFKLCKVLGCSADYLLGIKNESN